MLEVCLLGKFEIRLDNQPIEIHSRPAQALLAYLMLNAETSYRREKIAALLWPDSDEVSARSNLRQALWRLRKAVGEGYFRTNKISVGFNPQADYALDVDALQKDIVGSVSADRLIRMVSVYEGPLLPGFYDEWVIPAQTRLQAIFEDRMQMLLDRLIDEAHWREARVWAEWWISRGSVSEHAYRAFMMAAAGLGDRAGVAAGFQRCVEALEEDLGVEPSRKTRELMERLMSADRLPSDKIKPGQTAQTANLPIQPTPFIGREDELAQLSALLNDPSIKLITLLGPGGIGKTRLAIESAKAQPGFFSDGVFFVTLTSVDDPAMIVSQIGDAINFSFHVRDQRTHYAAEPQSRQLLAYLRGKNMLLVLDNLDHLLTPVLFNPGESRQGVNELISDIIRMAPRVKILATSRERLNLHGETGIVLSGLTYPERAQSTKLADMSIYGAVRLFVKSSRLVSPAFDLTPENLADVIEICRLADGMPLAIELAAAWVAMLTPAEIAVEIRNSPDFLETDLQDIPGRHRSIRKVFDHTWNRLSPTEQMVFMQLSVFRGGYTRLAAQKVSGANLQDLRALLDKSLIRRNDDGRYQIHELLRQLGTEQLARLPAEEAVANDRHCAFYALFMKEKEKDLIGRKQAQALSDIEIEIDNVRAAWQWAVTHAKLEEIDRIMESLAEFYRIRGGRSEVAEIFDQAALSLGWQGDLASDAHTGSENVFRDTMQLIDKASSITYRSKSVELVLGKVLGCSNRFYCDVPGQAWKAYRISQDSLEMLSRAGARKEMAWVLRSIGDIGYSPDIIIQLCSRALSVFEETGDRRGIAETLYRMGSVSTRIGDYRKAEEFYQNSLRISRQIDRYEIIAHCLAELGYVFWALGKYSAAEKKCRESLSYYREIGYTSQIAYAMRNLGRVFMGMENFFIAKQHFRNSLDIYEEIGLRGMKAITLGELAHVSVVEGALTEAEHLAETSRNLCEKLEYRPGLVVAHTALGDIEVRRGNLNTGRQHYHKALQWALGIQKPSDALNALAGKTMLLNATGEKQRVMELAYFIRNHPASWQWTRDCLAPLISASEDALSPDALKAARRWGEEKEVEEVIEIVIGNQQVEAE